MAIFPAVGITTEVEAVNSMLVAVGEAPVGDGIDLATYQGPDFLMARNIMRIVMRECQSEGWKFNTHFGVKVSPEVEDFDWLPTHTLINIFVLGSPQGYPVLAWKLTESWAKNKDLDLALWKSRQYAEGSEFISVLFDRKNGRDGPEASKFPFIYLDYTYELPFLELPDEARRYIVAASSRRLASQMLGSSERTQLLEGDEMAALRILRKKYGMKERKNALDNPSVAARTGRYPKRYGRTQRRIKE